MAFRHAEARSRRRGRPVIDSSEPFPLLRASRRRRRTRTQAAALVSVTLLAGSITADRAHGAQVARPLPTTTTAPPTTAPLATTAPPEVSWSTQIVQTDQLPQVLADQERARTAASTGIPSSSPAATAATSTTKKKPTTKKRRRRAVTTTTSLARVIAAADDGGSPSQAAVPAQADPQAAPQAASVGAKATASTGSANGGDGAGADGVWAALRKCESGGRYTLNTGNGYYGAYQFSATTWRRLGYSGLPHEASPAVQDEAAKKLRAKSGWGQWPACARKLGLR